MVSSVDKAICLWTCYLINLARLALNLRIILKLEWATYLPRYIATVDVYLPFHRHKLSFHHLYDPHYIFWSVDWLHRCGSPSYVENSCCIGHYCSGLFASNLPTFSRNRAKTPNCYNTGLQLHFSSVQINSTFLTRCSYASEVL